MKRKFLALISALVLLFSFLPFSANAIGNPFRDVPTNSYYYDAVTWALENGVTSGTSQTNFSPSATCTRGQVVTFLWRSQGQPEPTSLKNNFRDVSISDYFYKPVLWAVENGITKGTSDTTFSPNGTCTRAQVLTFLWRAEGEPSFSTASLLAEKYVNTYYFNAVSWADENKMLSDMGSTAFDATVNCPRSDIVTYLYRFSASPAYSKLTPTTYSWFNPSTVPTYSGSAFVKMNGNTPYFSLNNLTTTSYEMYGALDFLGRCTTCVACVGKDLMPTEARESISSIRPTGWQSVKYDNVEGGYLYNRSHLIGFQLTGENANINNLITGTRYFNINMLDYEDLIADYVDDYNAHILYRVTPVFEGNNLVAKGVLMEGISVEDQGKSVKFCVFMYNVQPGITIDYATGKSQLTQNKPTTQTKKYILNTNTHKFHLPSCSSVSTIKTEHRKEITATRDEVIAIGYESCKRCNP